MVLVVDDDSVARERVMSAVERVGCLAVPCGDPAAALARLDDGRADAALVAAHARGAIELVGRIKAARAGRALFPVLLLGAADGTDPPGLLRRGFAGGCDDFVAGPVDLGEVELRLAAQLRRREQAHAADRKKRELAALVVHDLRSPITGIAMAANLVRDSLEQASPDLAAAVELAQQIELVAHKALSIVAGLLDVEELEAGMLVARPVPIEVARLVDEVSRVVKTELVDRSVQLERQVGADLTGRFDPGLIARVLENLLYNAVRYAPRGGRVVMRAALEGDDLVLAIGNDGPPVPADDRDRIFERHYRIEARRVGARENRGLGLYFCHLAALAHGGTIAVEEEPDLPTVFVLRLPQDA